MSKPKLTKSCRAEEKEEEEEEEEEDEEDEEEEEDDEEDEEEVPRGHTHLLHQPRPFIHSSLLLLYHTLPLTFI